MPIGTYAQYQSLNRVDPLVAGDLLIKKVFAETCKHAVEWVITTGQRLFENDQKFKSGGFFSREKFRVAYQGSHTSEHAALAISAGELAEAVGEGVITASVRGRRAERYIVYRCKNHRLTAAAVMIAKGLSNAYHNVVTGQGGRTTTGGAYTITGALTSSLRGTTFKNGTNAFLTHIVDYVQGLRRDRPNMFCSQFAAACFEAGSLAEFGKTAMGTNPTAMSPMELENVLNGRTDLFDLVGKFDSENDALFAAVEKGMATYGHRWHFNQSKASKNAKTILTNLMEIGDNDYLLAAVAALLNTRPARPLPVTCTLPADSRLAPASQLYRDLMASVGPTGMLALHG